MFSYNWIKISSLQLNYLFSPSTAHRGACNCYGWWLVVAEKLISMSSLIKHSMVLILPLSIVYPTNVVKGPNSIHTVTADLRFHNIMCLCVIMLRENSNLFLWWTIQASKFVERAFLCFVFSHKRNLKLKIAGNLNKAKSAIGGIIINLFLSYDGKTQNLPPCFNFLQTSNEFKLTSNEVAIIICHP